jgi:multiple sugar transport system substrate-binding protein
MWHNYGGQMKTLMDELMDEFNRTVGEEKGIIINVTSISGSSALHDKLTSAAAGDPGAPELPDLTVAYPKTALVLAEKGLLADLSARFTEEELSAYVPRFLEEGRLQGGLYVFPIAKSTEALFVNKTIFDRFSADTGAAYEELSTFEGIVRTADQYYEWTDGKTPDIPNDGKAFYMPDSVFNLALIGMAQLGEDFLQGDGLKVTSDRYKRIWDSYFPSAVKGSAAVFDGYSTDLFKTGDVICSTGSTAGVLFYPSAVTYADNTKEEAEYAILPYPVLEGGKKIALQRGGGMCVVKSAEQKERAAAVFLKWFTEPERNLRFTASSGYLPVTEKAFGDAMSRQMEGIADENIKKLLRTVTVMQEEYDFFVPPLLGNYDELQKEYETRLKKAAKDARAQFEALAGTTDERAALETALRNGYEDFIKAR